MRILNVEQRTLPWYEARAGVITGTKLKQVVTEPRSKSEKLSETAKKMVYEIVSEKLTPCRPQEILTDAILWGQEYEAEALKEYEKRTGQKVMVAGFCLHDKYDHMGFSPDGFVLKKVKLRKIVEVKCPYSSKNHIRHIVDEGFMWEEHKWQVIQGLLVNTEATEVDLVSYDPRMVLESLRLHIINIKRKDVMEDIKKARKKTREFWKEVEKVHGGLAF